MNKTDSKNQLKTMQAICQGTKKKKKRENRHKVKSTDKAKNVYGYRVHRRRIFSRTKNVPIPKNDAKFGGLKNLIPFANRQGKNVIGKLY